MKGKNVRKDIVRDLLDKNFQKFTMQAASGVYPTLLIREPGTIARLLHFEMFVTQAEKLLQSSPTEAFYKGMITNIPRPDEAPQRLRIIPELSQIEQQYPLYDHQRIIDFIKKLSLSEEHLALCLQGSIDEAFNLTYINCC